MRLIRTLLLVLLALNLPGWAVAAMPACSQQGSMLSSGAANDAQMHAAMVDTASAAHCCSDGQSTGDQPAGNACHDGGHCQCGTLYQAAQPLQASIVPALPGVEQSPPFHAITAIALPHWRPPTSA